MPTPDKVSIHDPNLHYVIPWADNSAVMDLIKNSAVLGPVYMYAICILSVDNSAVWVLILCLQYVFSQ